MSDQPETELKAEQIVATITVPIGDEGTAYRLTLPDGRSIVVDERGDIYSKIASAIDDAFAGVRL